MHETLYMRGKKKKKIPVRKREGDRDKVNPSTEVRLSGLRVVS
jgi:hypothetical protein